MSRLPFISPAEKKAGKKSAYRREITQIKKGKKKKKKILACRLTIFVSFSEEDGLRQWSCTAGREWEAPLALQAQAKHHVLGFAGEGLRLIQPEVTVKHKLPGWKAGLGEALATRYGGRVCPG